MTTDKFDAFAELIKLKRQVLKDYEIKRWASDPMDLMWLFTPRVWRYRISGLLYDLAKWVDGGEDG